MTDSSMLGLTGSQLLAAATEFLAVGGYRQVISRGEGATLVRLMEDEYGVVGICLFDTWEQLHREWPRCQGELVEAMSAHMSRSDPKAWEGYLVLLSVGPVATEDAAAVNDLRYDTNRVRKIVATGSDITSVKDVETALLPLLPLQVEVAASEGSGVLERLPGILVNHGVPHTIAQTAIRAFVENESILDRLHESGVVK